MFYHSTLILVLIFVNKNLKLNFSLCSCLCFAVVLVIKSIISHYSCFTLLRSHIIQFLSNITTMLILTGVWPLQSKLSNLTVKSVWLKVQWSSMTSSIGLLPLFLYLGIFPIKYIIFRISQDNLFNWYIRL